MQLQWHTWFATWGLQEWRLFTKRKERSQRKRPTFRYCFPYKRYQLEEKCSEFLFRWECSFRSSWLWKSGLSSVHSFFVHPHSSGLQSDRLPIHLSTNDDRDNGGKSKSLLNFFTVAFKCVSLPSVFEGQWLPCQRQTLEGCKRKVGSLSFTRLIFRTLLLR